MSKLSPIKLKNFIKESGIPHIENSASFIFTCPRCGKSKKLYIRKSDGLFRCWTCSSKDTSFSGSAEFALAELMGEELGDIRRALEYHEFQPAKRLNIKITHPGFVNNEEDNVSILDEVQITEVVKNPDFIDIKNQYFQPAFDYLLNKRGLDESDIVKYNIWYNPAWQTVVFPIFFYDKLVGWQERSIKNSFKYTLKGFKKEKYLMFLDKIRPYEHIVLTEGPVSGIKADLCGGNVVSMGKGVSPFQIKLIQECTSKIYLGLDRDAGQEIRALCQELSFGNDVRLLFPPDHRDDLGDCTKEEVLEQFNKAPKWSGQLFLNIKRHD